ncbi:MAG: trehalose-phosphatase [Myxococcaceae bacterium]
MRYLFAREGEDVLAQLAFSRVLLAFDFDGTLAPIVSDPAGARLRPGTRALLRKVAGRYPCAVISGRSRADVSGRVRGLGLAEIVGNHGIEPGSGTGRFQKQIAAWRGRLQAKLGGLRGVVIEDKVFSLAVHYRQSREKRRARAEIFRVATMLPGVRLVDGKSVLNLLPPGAPHKGLALERVRDRLGCDTALYVGDDDTDEDVFTLDQPGRLLAIRVGSNRRSAATYFLRAQREIDRLLRALLRAPERASPPWSSKR